MTAYNLLLVAIAVQRVSELVLGRRNAARARARGGVETGRAHLGPMVVLHGTFLIACAAEVALLERPFVPAVGIPASAALAASMALRFWTLRELGDAWSPRVVVVPGRAVVRTGPYRYVRHPNYLAVAVEMAAIPLIHCAWLTALCFSVLNSGLLVVRIRCEERALAAHCPGAQGLAELPRFWPRMGRAADPRG